MRNSLPLHDVIEKMAVFSDGLLCDPCCQAPSYADDANAKGRIQRNMETCSLNRFALTMDSPFCIMKLLSENYMHLEYV